MFWGLFLIVVLLPVVAASIDGVNISIKTSGYQGGDVIRGNVQLKIINENPTLNISSNFQGSISLIDLLRRNSFSEGNEYKCNTKNCTTAVSAKGLFTSPLTMTVENKTVGFNLTGEDISIQSLRLSVNSDAAESCIGQLRADLLDSNISLVNANYKAIGCGEKARGCFSPSSPTEIAEISNNQQNPYCEKITLPTGPGYNLSAVVINSTKAYAELTLTLYDANWVLIDSCILPKHSTHSGDLGCIINSSRAYTQDYLLCISAKPGIESNYTLSTETSSPICGTSQKNSNSFSRDYPLSGQALTFAQPAFEINESSVVQVSGKSLVNLLNTYLGEIYSSNCTKGCAIPFVLRSGIGQQVSFTISELKYISKGALLTNTGLFQMEPTTPVINAEKINITLDHANFTIPRGTKETFFALYAGSNRLFNPVPLSLQAGFDFDVYPNIASIGLSTLFNIGGKENISHSVWKFGDGKTETVRGRVVYHTFTKSGNNSLEVTATRSDGAISMKNFTVSVGNANTSAKLLMPYISQKISNLSSEIAKLPSWKAKYIEERINVTGLKNELENLQKIYASASSDENYTAVVEGVLKIQVPSQVAPSMIKEDLLLSGLVNANLQYLASISKVGEKDLSEDSLKRAIVNWTDRSYKADIKKEVYSMVLDEKESEIATFYTLDIKKISESASPAFVIIGSPKKQIYFDKSYESLEVSAGSSNGIAIPISEDKTISFAFPGNIELSSLGAYLAPDIKYLESEKVEAKPFFIYNPWKTAWSGVIATILLFLIVYIILQEWYKRRYEGHLFHNSDDLYNMVNFIYNARAQSLTDGDIRKKLAETGWNSEQIVYALKKIDGKRTGMYEIPIFKFLENRKVKKEIEKRQEEPIDARFIKRPSF